MNNSRSWIAIITLLVSSFLGIPCARAQAQQTANLIEGAKYYRVPRVQVVQDVQIVQAVRGKWIR